LEIKSQNKLEAVQEVAEYFIGSGYKIIEMDLRRPWGFYFYFDRKQTAKFAKEFFSGVELEGIDTKLPLQPKVLVFEPKKRASWQYHNRRSEIWRCITKDCFVSLSKTDKENSAQLIKFGDVASSRQGIRHRAGASLHWGAVAEIWQHTDPKNLSNEEDITRLQDDFGR
jgi:hypothetical protein